MKKLNLIPLYIVFISIFLLAAANKFSSGYPEWFVKSFEPTVINLFPSQMWISFYTVAVLEGLTAALFLVSLAKREFLPTAKKPVLKLAFFVAMLTFSILGFGRGLLQEYDGVFQHFVFFSLTFILQTLIFTGMSQKEV